MMRVFLLLTLLLGVGGGLAVAETYKCRDSQGRLHFADSQLALPAECLGREQKIDLQQPSEHLQYVPETPAPRGSGIEFEHSVRAAEQERQRDRQREVELRQRADGLVELYQRSVVEKRAALRSWSYSSREKIMQAEEKIRQVREGKRQLLDELVEQPLAGTPQRQIEQRLEQIAEQ